MSGPKSASYQLSATAAARRAEQQALGLATSRFRVLFAELETLRTVATETATAFGHVIEIPALPVLQTGQAREVETQTAAIERTLIGLRLQVHEVQRIAEAKRLYGYLSTLVAFEDAPSDGATTATPTAQTSAESGESLRTRAERHFAALIPGARLSAHAVDIAAGLASAPPDLAVLALRDLQAEVGAINRSARRQAAVDDRLRDLDVRVGALDDSGLLREVLFARGDLGGVTEEQLSVLEGRVADAEKDSVTAAKREAARLAMERALFAEGYQVLTGFETAIPQDGVLVRKPGLDFHAWRVAFDDDSIRLEVVRTALEADTRTATTRDVEAETKICADLPAVLDRIADAGIDVDRIRRLAPGDSPVAVLPNATPVQQSTTSARTAEGRSL